MQKVKIASLFIALLFSASLVQADGKSASEQESGFLDKATELTNKALDKSKVVVKDVIDKTTKATNQAIDKSKELGKKAIDKATEMTNAVLKSDDDKAEEQKQDKDCGDK